MFELVIAVSLAVLGGGIVWAHRMSKKVEAEKKKIDETKERLKEEERKKKEIEKKRKATNTARALA